MRLNKEIVEKVKEIEKIIVYANRLKEIVENENK